MSLIDRLRQQRSARRAVLAPVLLAIVVACADASTGADAPTATPSTDPLASTVPATPRPTDPRMIVGDEGGPCEAVGLLRDGIDGLRAVPLRIENRTTLDIELSNVQTAYEELERADLGPLEDQLEDPVRRLGYRLIDLEIAVEDFRTNPRPRRAAGHVDEDAAAFSDALAGITILGRC